MMSVVLAVATEDEKATECTLRDIGYQKREVWVRYVMPERKEDEESALRRLGVAQFLVSDYWGRGVE
jgi:hypothetical protein